MRVSGCFDRLAAPVARRESAAPGSPPFLPLQAHPALRLCQARTPDSGSQRWQRPVIVVYSADQTTLHKQQKQNKKNLKGCRSLLG